MKSLLQDTTQNIFQALNWSLNTTRICQGPAQNITASWDTPLVTTDCYVGYSVSGRECNISFMAGMEYKGEFNGTSWAWYNF